MKKLISVTLVLILVLSLCACGASEEKKDPGLQVGYGRVDITPDYPMNIAGSAADRTAAGYMDPIYITFVALRYEEETFLLATMDLVGAYKEYSEPAHSRVSQETGIPSDHIILNSTHTHSSVSIRNIENTGAAQYREELYDWAVEAAKAALEDLSPAEVWYSSFHAEGMAWVRHYKMADGTYAGANYGSFTNSAIVGHASEADTEMQIVKFVRPAEDKKDVVLVNFPAHATMQKEDMISADFPGPFRDYVSENTDTLVAYFIAGAGDQTPTSRVATEQFSSDYSAYGKELGCIAVECMRNMTKLEGEDISFSKRTFTGKSCKEDMDRMPDAQAVKMIWDQVGGRGTDAGKKAAKEYGFSSVYEVTAILNRAGTPENRSMDLKTLAIGDVAFIFAPYEMFGSNAMQIKKDSPYAMTFVVTCSENHEGYLPSALGCELRCYEAQITKYAYGTAELLVAEYLDMLNQMKNPQK